MRRLLVVYNAAAALDALIHNFCMKKSCNKARGHGTRRRLYKLGNFDVIFRYTALHELLLKRANDVIRALLYFVYLKHEVLNERVAPVDFCSLAFGHFQSS